MRSTVSCLVAALLTVVAAPSAYACRVTLSPEARIARAYSEDENLKVAVVSITDARELSLPMSFKIRQRFPEAPIPWRATAMVTRMMVGHESPELILFDGNVTDCDDDDALPAKGDQWVLYYIAEGFGQATVVEKYRLDVARRADPRISSPPGEQVTSPMIPSATSQP